MEYIIIAIVVAAVGLAYVESKKDKKTKPVKSSKSTGSSSKKETDTAQSVSHLKKLTKQQLLDHADKNNIKVKRSGSKAEVVKAIAKHK
jgi:hypothetical protein